MNKQENIQGKKKQQVVARMPEHLFHSRSRTQTKWRPLKSSAEAQGRSGSRFYPGLTGPSHGFEWVGGLRRALSGQQPGLTNT